MLDSPDQTDSVTRIDRTVPIDNRQGAAMKISLLRTRTPAYSTEAQPGPTGGVFDWNANSPFNPNPVVGKILLIRRRGAGPSDGEPEQD